METDFGTYRKLMRVQRVLAVVLVVACAGLYGEVRTDAWRTLTGMGLVVALLALLMLVVGCLAHRCTKCPHCGKSFMSMWWNYGRRRLIEGRLPFPCAHCGEEVDTD